jgi:hypothetical protein
VTMTGRYGNGDGSIWLYTVDTVLVVNIEDYFLMSLRASLKRCFTIMRVRIVPGCKLAHRKEMVSRPPEKMRSTATAEPVKHD